MEFGSKCLRLFFFILSAELGVFACDTYETGSIQEVGHAVVGLPFYLDCLGEKGYEYFKNDSFHCSWSKNGSPITPETGRHRLLCFRLEINLLATVDHNATYSCEVGSNSSGSCYNASIVLQVNDSCNSQLCWNTLNAQRIRNRQPAKGSIKTRTMFIALTAAIALVGFLVIICILLQRPGRRKLNILKGKHSPVDGFPSLSNGKLSSIEGVDCLEVGYEDLGLDHELYEDIDLDHQRKSPARTRLAKQTEDLYVNAQTTCVADEPEIPVYACVRKPERKNKTTVIAQVY